MQKFNEKYGVTLIFLIPFVVFILAFTDHLIIYLTTLLIFAIYSFTVEKKIREKHPNESREESSRHVGNYVLPAVVVFLIVNTIFIFI